MAALGDSITSGAPGYDPDPAARDRFGFGANPRSQYEYWAKRGDPRFEFRNCGVFGELTEQIAARLDDCVRGADVLVVQGGINDVVRGRRLELPAAHLLAMVQRGRDLGLEVLLADVLPWNNGHPQADRRIGRLNRAIHGIARDQHVPVLPFHRTLEDPERPGLMKPAWTADGDHPSVEGYRRLGELAFRLPGGARPGDGD